MKDSLHTRRIKEELKRAGVTKYGLLKDESRYLDNLIHEDEHIAGVIYGRYAGGSAMLVATDKRVLFFDKKPLYSTSDELTYDVVSGLKITQNGLATSATLHTRLGDYTLRFVNRKTTDTFRKYLESHLLEHPQQGQQYNEATLDPKPATPILSKAASSFLRSGNIATLSTVDRTGNVHGAVVHYHFSPQNGALYVLTKPNSQKVRDVYAHNQAAVTIYDVDSLKTLQLTGFVAVETDMKIKRDIFDAMIKPHQYGEKKQQPPVFQLPGDEFVVLKIVLATVKFSDFKK